MGSEIQKQYTMIDQAQIYQFGKIKIYRDMNNNQFFFQTYNFIVDPNATQEFISHLIKKNNSCPYLMQIRNIELTQQNYCSNSVKLTVAFEYVNLTVQNLIDRNHQFNQSQVLKLFHNLLTAVKQLNSNQSSHGDICPQFIYAETKAHKYFCLQLGEHVYKIFDSVYFKPILTGYYRAQKEKTYCAPQILTNLCEKRVYPLYNILTADTFSIGLVVLYCMTLINPLGAYNRSYEIDFYYLQSMFRLAERKGFNLNLIELIRQCLVQKNRPNVSQILLKFQKLHMSQYIKASFNKFSLKKSKHMHNSSYNLK